MWPMASPTILAPEGYNRNSAADAAKIIFGLDRSAKGIFLREFRRHHENLIFSPLQAGALESPEWTRLGG